MQSCLRAGVVAILLGLGAAPTASAWWSCGQPCAPAVHLEQQMVTCYRPEYRTEFREVERTVYRCVPETREREVRETVLRTVWRQEQRHETVMVPRVREVTRST